MIVEGIPLKRLARASKMGKGRKLRDEISFIYKPIKLVYNPDLNLPRKKVSYVADTHLGYGFFPQEVYESKPRRWCRHPKWRKNTVPVITFAAERATPQRLRIIKNFRKINKPTILLFCAGGHNPESVCDPPVYMSLSLPSSVILFTYGRKMSKEQMAVFYHLLEHYDEIPEDAMGYLMNIGSIEYK